MKIVYVLPTIAPNRGAERIITEKANYLTKNFGYIVYIINLFQDDETTNSYPLSHDVQQINLGIPNHTQYYYKYPKRLWKKIIINHNLQKKLYQKIHSIEPDIIIGVSYSKAELVCKIPYNAKKVIECHEPRLLGTSKIINGSFISKFYAKHYYFRTIEKKADAVVTLTNEDKYLWNKAKRVEVIPNFSSMYITQYSTCEEKRVIAVGRLCEEKGFERLINIWRTNPSKYSDWQLVIYGEGYLKTKLATLINTNHLNNVFIRGNTNNISKEYAASSICVVSSYFEGFSLVTLEAMRHGVPCVAFNCPYGPANIIKDNQCGFLIDNNNNALFAEKLCLLIDDSDLRKRFSHNCLERAKQFDVGNIMNHWKALFEGLYTELHGQ